MKQFGLQLAVLLFITACQESIVVHLEKEPGAVAGIVHPKNVQATVGLYQEVLIAEVTTADDGIFRLEDVPPGTYLLRVSAEGYGTLTRKNVNVTDDETTFVGELLLGRLPWPVRSVEPSNGSTVEEAQVNILIRFYEDIKNSTVAGAFSINPVVENLEFEINYYSGGDHLRITGNFMLGTTYTFTLDTTLSTHFEQHLEFPLSSTFTIIPFQIINVRFPSYNYGEFIISFNSTVPSENLLANLNIIPETPITITTYDRYRSYPYYPYTSGTTDAYIRPTPIWRPGATTTISISGELAEERGATLGADTSFTFDMDSLAVIDTNPYDNQYFVSTGANILIRFNTLVDEGTITDAFSLSPSQVLDFSTYQSGRYSSVTILPDTLINSTTYTVLVDTTIKDYWGGTMSAPYSFSFTTK